MALAGCFRAVARPHLLAPRSRILHTRFLWRRAAQTSRSSRFGQLRAATTWDAPGLPSSSQPDLDWKPTVGIWATLRSSLVASILVGAVCAISRPTTIPSVLIALAALFVTQRVVHATLLEHQYAERLVVENDLADPDSRFRELLGVTVHYKVQDALPTPRRPTTTAIHCYHGFGASSFSFAPTLPLLAARLPALATAHDMPGFGLTSRPPPSSPSSYLLTFNAKLGRAVQYSELAARSLIGATELRDTLAHLSTPSAPPPPSLSTAHPGIKRVLLGHSLGTACAALQAMQDPRDVHALILVSPAIVASPPAAFAAVELVPSTTPSDLSPGCEAFVPVGPIVDPPGGDRPHGRGVPVGGFIRGVMLTLKALLFWVVARILRAAEPLLLMGLRGAVRSRDFWTKGLANAWSNAAKLTPQVVDGYRKAQLVRGFDAGFLAFVYSRLSPYSSLWEALRQARTPDHEDSDLPNRLSCLVRQHKIPTLIVHGRDDKLIPLSNSKQLARMLPGCELVVMAGCGHVPHEELPEEFVEVVADFLAQLEA